MGEQTRRFIAVALCALGGPAISVAAAVRVAFLDFTSDDNSWPSSQAAANFTAALQARLSSESEIVWVEREQLKLAERELLISELGRMAGTDAVRRGKWVKADWLLQGRFAFDGDDERIIRLELLDLNHAELLSEKTVSLSGEKSIVASTSKLNTVALAVKGMLQDGKEWLKRATNQTVVAPLCFVEVTGRPQNLWGNLRPLERKFQEFAAEWLATNQSTRVIRFPKAYQSLDEAVMAVGGFTGEEPWKRIADLYVWGTCGITNRPNATEDARGNAVRVTVNSWDGIGEPVRNEELIRFRPGSELPVIEALATLDRMLTAAFQQARRGTEAQDTATVRKRIASSLIRDFEAMSSSNTDHSLGLTFSDDERERFKEIVRMLEAACFFDPDNPGAHARRIRTRWGWWTGFDTLSSEFWTAWRCSEEWGKFAERFGLATVASLPFPFAKSGIAGAYEGSINGLAGMMEVSNKEESYGFPAQVPEEVETRWRSEIKAEVRTRRQKVAEALRGRENPNLAASTKLSGSETDAPQAAPPAAPWAQTNAIAPTAVTAGSSPTNWVKNWPALFVVQRPNLLPRELSPKLEVISFPRRAAVAAVNRLIVYDDTLWIVAEDEASEGANVPQPDISVEMRAEASRLWRCPLQSPKPRLVQKRGIPRYVTTVAIQGDTLWIAGNGIARLHPKTGAVKGFGTREGFTLGDVTSVTPTEKGDVFAVGDSCKILRLPADGSAWQEVSMSGAGEMSYGTDEPLRLCAQSDHLLLVAAALILREPASNSWTNFGRFQSRVHDVAADATGIWIAEDRGLTLFEGAQRRIESWRADEGPSWPVSDSLTNPRMALLRESSGYDFWRDRQVSQEENAEGRLLHAFKEFAQARARALERRQERASTTGLSESPSRLPGGVAALAHDGEFLWLGLAHPAMVMLYHKPSDSFIGHVKLTDSVRSLAVSRDHLWLGFGYQETILARLDKRDLLLLPREQWVPNRVSAAELARVLSELPLRQQALSAFFAGDHAMTLALLDLEATGRSDLEALFLRAFCHGFWGLNNPDACHRAFEVIITRFPESPWEKAARAAIADDEEARNNLNKPPKTPEELAQEQRRAETEFDEQIESVFQRSDTNGDQKLNPIEAGLFWTVLQNYFRGGNDMSYKRHLYDTNRDSHLDKSEFRVVLEKLHKEKAAAARNAENLRTR